MDRKYTRSRTLQGLYDEAIGTDPATVDEYERAVIDAHIAGDVYRLRTEAGLTQRELAARIGTTASVICRLEDANYTGHSLPMLRRIASAVGKRVEIRFVDDTRERVKGVKRLKERLKGVRSRND